MSTITKLNVQKNDTKQPRVKMVINVENNASQPRVKYINATTPPSYKDVAMKYIKLQEMFKLKAFHIYNKHGKKENWTRY